MARWTSPAKASSWEVPGNYNNRYDIRISHVRLRSYKSSLGRPAHDNTGLLQLRRNRRKPLPARPSRSSRQPGLCTSDEHVVHI